MKLTYFSHISAFYCTKNKLEETVLGILKNYDRRVIPDHEQHEVQKKIIEEIEGLNLQFKRCKPIKASFSKLPMSQDWVLSLSSNICHFRIYVGRELQQ